MDQTAFFLILLTGTFDISSSTPRQFYYVNESKTWEDAQSYCRENYIDLATVDSMEEVNLLHESVYMLDPGYGGAVWIGLKRSWAWSTGDSLNYSYTYWSSYQPNEKNTEGTCLAVMSEGWNDFFCSRYFNFFCFDDSPTASKRFILVTIKKTWAEAQTYCKQKYTDLAIISDAEDAASLQVYSIFTWIGLISSQWSDGGFSPFRYWTSESAESSVVDECTAMNVTNSGKWFSTECNLQLPFICYGGVQLVTRQYYYVDYPKTWLNAQKYCRSRFTDLATIDSINDVNTLMNEVVLGYNGSLWIGLNRSTQAQWGWSHGDEPLSNYSNWDAERPNGSGQCAVNINNVWHDYNCTVPLYFVCYNESTGYIMVQSNKTWQDAQSYCRNYYTDLVTIHSPWEQKQLIELVGRRALVWIGLFLDTWEWSDQWSLFYRNWALGQPNSMSGTCTAMMKMDSGKWTVQNCNIALPFICYGEKKPVTIKNIIRIKMSYNGTAYLNDLSMQAVILNEVSLRVVHYGTQIFKKWNPEAIRNTEKSIILMKHLLICFCRIQKKYIWWSMANNTKLSWNVMSDGNVFVKQEASDER